MSTTKEEHAEQSELFEIQGVSNEVAQLLQPAGQKEKAASTLPPEDSRPLARLPQILAMYGAKQLTSTRVEIHWVGRGTRSVWAPVSRGSEWWVMVSDTTQE